MAERLRDEASGFCASQFPKLVGGLTLYLGDRAVAEEVAQEALLRACGRWEHVRGLRSPQAWVWRVALNLANSTFRRRAAERRARQRLQTEHDRAGGDRAGGDWARGGAGGQWAGGWTGGGAGDGDPTVRLAVRSAVSRLPRRQRTALVLRYYLDLPVAETAERMGLTHNAVRSLTKRAVAALRADLGADDPASRITQEG